MFGGIDQKVSRHSLNCNRSDGHKLNYHSPTGSRLLQDPMDQSYQFVPAVKYSTTTLNGIAAKFSRFTSLFVANDNKTTFTDQLPSLDNQETMESRTTIGWIKPFNYLRDIFVGNNLNGSLNLMSQVNNMKISSNIEQLIMTTDNSDPDDFVQIDQIDEFSLASECSHPQEISTSLNDKYYDCCDRLMEEKEKEKEKDIVTELPDTTKDRTPKRNSETFEINSDLETNTVDVHTMHPVGKTKKSRKRNRKRNVSPKSNKQQKKCNKTNKAYDTKDLGILNEHVQQQCAYKQQDNNSEWETVQKRICKKRRRRKRKLNTNNSSENLKRLPQWGISVCNKKDRSNNKLNVSKVHTKIETMASPTTTEFNPNFFYIPMNDQQLALTREKPHHRRISLQSHMLRKNHRLSTHSELDVTSLREPQNALESLRNVAGIATDSGLLLPRTRQRQISECSDDSFICFEDDECEPSTSGTVYDQLENDYNSEWPESDDIVESETDLEDSDDESTMSEENDYANSDNEITVLIKSPITTNQNSADQIDSGFEDRKRVRFNLKPSVHEIVAWDYAYRKARKGPWEQICRDRSRFMDRIRRMESVLNPILDREHRKQVYSSRFENKKIEKLE